MAVSIRFAGLQAANQVAHRPKGSELQDALLRTVRNYGAAGTRGMGFVLLCET